LKKLQKNPKVPPNPAVTRFRNGEKSVRDAGVKRKYFRNILFLTLKFLLSLPLSGCVSQKRVILSSDYFVESGQFSCFLISPPSRANPCAAL
jgi:hypothetical protein